jgi:multidrug efflux pump subunit AcrA (membrane-fusion protein)
MKTFHSLQQAPVRWATVVLVLLAVLAFVLALMLPACSKATADGNRAAQVRNEVAQVSHDGQYISFDKRTTGLEHFATQQAQITQATVSIIAPARVVASISGSDAGSGVMVLFDNTDLTTLYASYRQARSALALAQNNAKRMQEMFANQGATAKDVNQAETELATARAVLADTDGRLRANGFNPKELEAAQPRTVWLICDVPESQLHEVQHGEEVDVQMASFPDKTLYGRADAIGDVIDPSTRTVKVRVTLRNADGKLLPGMFGKVNIAEPQNNVVALPVGAVVTVEGNDYVFVQQRSGGNGDTIQFERRAVRLASASTTQALVSKGLQNGERVVTTGAILLKGLSFGF